ncbi:hypothetical protein IC757_12120 [Wenzhouxiangella sp. AB-CW3]|uniref:hypothetical protein n=1 Tax=Wenzhouxiangella sp. AB-CW3 TaxID=2771012 RepID=UPI00168B351C|nr:hypothetical protein [Wenzhouxiangella sp. AB-CW3]QOC21778.1 hypothetical protein IC757_12120 [Wenzhouxiangella sp. AB-CW3]
MNRTRRLARCLLIGSAAAAFLGLSLQAHALPTCTVERWTNSLTEGLDDSNTGYQGSGNRRYGGPCGLRVPVDGSERYVGTDSPNNETTYKARFYVFLDYAGDEDVLIFAAQDQNDEDVIQVWFQPGNDHGDLVLQVYDDGGSAVSLSADGIGGGWHSVQLVWASDDNAEIRFAVNHDDETQDLVTTHDTSGVPLVRTFLGNINGADGGTNAHIDFDDFDSRRDTRPGRLCRGLTDPDRAPASDGWQEVNSDDRQAIFVEMATGGGTPAGGQPDFNEDGVVNSDDRFAIFAAMATGQNSCEVLR